MLTVTEPFCCLSLHMHLLQGTAYCSFLHSAWQLVLQTKRLIEHFLKLSTALVAGAENHKMIQCLLISATVFYTVQSLNPSSQSCSSATPYKALGQLLVVALVCYSSMGSR